MAGRERLAEDMNQLLRFSQDNHVGEGRERHRVGEGQRPAADDERVPPIAFGTQKRYAREPEHLEKSSNFQLVAYGECQAGKVAERALALVGTELIAILVGQKGALGGGALVLVDLAIDGLEPERAHPHV